MANGLEGISKLLFLAVVVGLAISSIAQSPTTTTTPAVTAQTKRDVSRVENAQPQSANIPAKISPTAINQTTSQPTQRTANTKREASQHAAPFNWSRLNTALLTLFNLVLALVAIFQYRLTRRQTELTETGLVAAKNASEASQKSADAAVRAVAQAEQATSLTQRAVILLESVVAEPQLSPKAPYGPSDPYFRNNSVLIFTLKNFGSTVAHAVQLKGYVHFLSGGRQIRDTPEAAMAPQGSNEWITSSLFMEASQSDLATFNNKEGEVWYEVEVMYKDAFKQSHTYKAQGRYIPLLRDFVITGSTSD